MIRTLAIALLLMLPFASLIAMASGTGWPEWELPGGLPLGNLLAAAMLASWPAAAVLLATPRSAARRIAALALLGSLAWLPVSALLAGNVALNFSGGRGTTWFALTLALLAIGLLSLAWSALHQLRRRRSRQVPG